MTKSAGAVAEPEVEEQVDRQREVKRKKQPRYHVVLWDDPNHTYDYVIRMMQELFRHELGRARQMASEVDNSGRVICLTTTLEHAELKRDQVRAYGRDPLSASSTGSMTASIEPAR